MLEECSSQLEQCDTQLHELQAHMEACRSATASISKEIDESGATISNLRDNIIVQNLTRDIAKTQAEIDSYDMEEAGKARRNYEDKYEPAKVREDKLSEKVCLSFLFSQPHSDPHLPVSPTDRRTRLAEGTAQVVGERSQRVQGCSQEVH